MKIIKKLMQIALAVFFFGLLATSAVLADDADSEGWQFVQENGRTYYKKGDLKETYWRVIDGKYYYFDPLSGEMVVGWQYIPFPSKGSTIGPYPNGLRLEFMPMPRWYYFNQVELSLVQPRTGSPTVKLSIRASKPLSFCK